MVEGQQVLNAEVWQVAEIVLRGRVWFGVFPRVTRFVGIGMVSFKIFFCVREMLRTKVHFHQLWFHYDFGDG